MPDPPPLRRVTPPRRSRGDDDEKRFDPETQTQRYPMEARSHHFSVNRSRSKRITRTQYEANMAQLQEGRAPARKRRMSRNSSGSQFYAQPYDPSGTGFYFDSAEELDEGIRKSRHEEFEIQFIDGDGAELANMLLSGGHLNQANMDRWYDDIEPLREDEKAALYYAIAYHGETDLDDALALVEDELRPMEGDAKDYLYELVESSGGLEPAVGRDALERYFDFEAFGRDRRINGEHTYVLLEDLADAEQEGDEERAAEIQEEIDRREELSDQELGEEYVDEEGFGQLTKSEQEMYFDYDSYARDLELGGDVTTFVYDGTEYVISV